MEKVNSISRSPGVCVSGCMVGGGRKGLTQELDDIVVKEAEFMRSHYKTDVTIRFNSDRMSGGAWLVDSAEDSFGSNSSIGLGASLFNSKLRSMSVEEQIAMSCSQFRRMLNEPDSICFTTYVDLEKAEHSLQPDIKHILLNAECRNFDTLKEAIGHLADHVFGLKTRYVSA